MGQAGGKQTQRSALPTIADKHGHSLVVRCPTLAVTIEPEALPCIREPCQNLDSEAGMALPFDVRTGQLRHRLTVTATTASKPDFVLQFTGVPVCASDALVTLPPRAVQPPPQAVNKAPQTGGRDGRRRLFHSISRVFHLFCLLVRSRRSRCRPWRGVAARLLRSTIVPSVVGGVHVREN